MNDGVNFQPLVVPVGVVLGHDKWRRVLLPRRQPSHRDEPKRSLGKCVAFDYINNAHATFEVQIVQLMGTHRQQKAFTLVELMTVIAIIGILATLMLTAVSSAKKASHRARCVSNLHQISLALNMYIDDFEKRSPDLAHLTSNRYLGNRQILLCPDDKTAGWGNLVNSAPLAGSFSAEVNSQVPINADTNVIPFSYLNPLPWENWAWDRLSKSGNQAGLAVCQLHGLGRPNLVNPSYQDFQGVLLRAQRDGAVVQREIYWVSNPYISTSQTSPDSTTGPMSTYNAGDSSGGTSTFNYPWKLFSDDPNP